MESVFDLNTILAVNRQFARFFGFLSQVAVFTLALTHFDKHLQALVGLSSQHLMVFLRIVTLVA
jgi:hypothetical protein